MFRSKKSKDKSVSKGVTPITSFFQSRSSSQSSSVIFNKKSSPSARIAISPEKIASIGSSLKKSHSLLTPSTSLTTGSNSARKNLFDALSQPVASSSLPSSSSSSSSLSGLKKRNVDDGFEEDDLIEVTSSFSTADKRNASSQSSRLDTHTNHELEFIRQNKKKRTMVQNFKPPALLKSRSTNNSSSFSTSSPSSKHANNFGSHGRPQYQTSTSGGSPSPGPSQGVKSIYNSNSMPKLRVLHTTKNSILSSSSSSFNDNSGYTGDGNIVFTVEQKAVLDYIVRDNLNVFYTGSAGTGKSVLLKTIIKKLKMKFGPTAIAVCASTGLASVNIGGITVHKFCGFGIGQGTPMGLAAMVKKNRTSMQRWKDTRVLIIDEISMIDGSFLDKLDFVARTVLKNNKPFGGIQIVLTGDFFQLPPIEDRNAPSGSMRFCFQSKVWEEAIHKTILLNKVFRQKDNDLIDMLNEIRYGEKVSLKTMNLIKSLDREIHYEDNIEPTELYPTRFEVLRANTRRMENLKGLSQMFKSIDQFTHGGDQKREQQEKNMLNNSFLVEEDLLLKEHAQVMMVKNIDDELVNGTVGIVMFFTTQEVYDRSRKIYNGVDKNVYIREMRLLSRCCMLNADEDVPDEVKNYIISGDNLIRARMDFLITKARAKKPRASSPLEEVSHILPVVKFSLPRNRFKEVLVTRQEFKIELSKSNRDNFISRVQLPLILCYAISIHKAQGQTIQRLKVDLLKVFEVGQIYVALSRAVSKDSLEIKNFNIKKLRANDTVKTFYQSLERVAD